MPNATDIPEELRPVPLDPELVDYVRESRLGGLMLHHPYVIELVILEGEDGELLCLPHTNAFYHHKASAIQKSLEEQDWSQLLWLHERPYRVEAFEGIQDQLDGPTYWNLLRELWIDSENQHEWGDDLIRAMFQDEREGDFMEEGDRWEWDQIVPTDAGEVIIYRGWCVEGAAKGWSWTFDKHRAAWFAKRFANVSGGVPHVTTGYVRKDHVYGYLNGRNEYEVVVDWRDVRVESEEEVTDNGDSDRETADRGEGA